MKKNTQLITIWHDLVGMKDLILAILIAITLTMVGFFLAPKENTTLQLVFGLIGSIGSFIINAKIITPKRRIHQQTEEQHKKVGAVK